MTFSETIAFIQYERQRENRLLGRNGDRPGASHLQSGVDHSRDDASGSDDAGECDSGLLDHAGRSTNVGDFKLAVSNSTEA